MSNSLGPVHIIVSMDLFFLNVVKQWTGGGKRTGRRRGRPTQVQGKVS